MPVDIMNDFTKSELEIIFLNLCMNPRTKEVLLKLESMIGAVLNSDIPESVKKSCSNSLKIEYELVKLNARKSDDE
jgi:hypothetical protein